ncbi:MAG: hypothetical protein ACI4RJ_00995 [Alphaproteobacteria bacterium]
MDSRVEPANDSVSVYAYDEEKMASRVKPENDSVKVYAYDEEKMDSSVVLCLKR